MNATLNKRFHAIINKKGLKGQKSEIVNGATAGRSSSSKDLTDADALAIISKLEEGEAPLSKADKTLYALVETQKKERKLSKAFFCFRQMGFTTTTDKLDYTRIDAFCLAKSKAKKTLTNMDSTELTNLIFQVEAILKKK